MQGRETVTMSLRLDKELKAQADALFNDIGMSMTTALNVFLRQAVREGGIPFEITTRSSPNEETLAALREVEAMKGNLAAYKSYDNFHELIEELGDGAEV